MMVAAIWLGMMLYLVRPVQAETASSSFASWLDTVVKRGDVDSDALRQQLYKLKKSDESLDTLIQKASEIISHHNEDFNLPLDTGTSDSRMVYDLLVWEWNSFQTGNGMGKASLPATIKSNIHPTIEKFAPSFSGLAGKQFDRFCFALNWYSGFYFHVKRSVHIIPLSGGVAIGAP